MRAFGRAGSQGAPQGRGRAERGSGRFFRVMLTRRANGFALLDAVHAPTRRRGCGRSQRCRPCGQCGSSSPTATGRGCAGAAKARSHRPRWASTAPMTPTPATGSNAAWAPRGYKAHFTETCEPDRSHLIVHVATTWRGPPTWRPCQLATPTSPASSYCPTSTWSTRPTSAWTACWTPAPTTAWSWSVRYRRTPAGKPATRVASTSPGSASTGTTSRSPAPTARPPATGARHQPHGVAHCAGHLPHLRLHAVSRPRPLHPPPTNPRHLTFRPRPQYEAQRQLRAEQATGLAGPPRPPLGDRGHHRAGLSPQRPPPGPLPRPGQDPPTARADRAGAQPGPRRRLAHRHPAGQQLGLPPHQTPTSTVTG
jgi:hypothetical protein